MLTYLHRTIGTYKKNYRDNPLEGVQKKTSHKSGISLVFPILS